MRYRQRNQDGTLGEWVLTPAGETDAKKTAELEREIERLRNENNKLKKQKRDVSIAVDKDV